MASKRLKIENLEYLDPLNTEEVFRLQGGEGKSRIPEPKSLIYVDAENPMPKRPPERPKWPIYHPLPHYPCSHYPTKNGKLPWCAVIL